MTKLANKMKRRPRLGVTLGVVVALVLIATLVPLKVDQTVGYEVALAGVDKDLAMDTYQLQVLLDALGCGEADVVVGDCEATCQLTISDLKSEDDVQKVVLAFDELGNCVLQDVSEITESENVSMFTAAKIEMFSRQANIDEAVFYGDGEIHEIVISCLDELSSDSNCSFGIWIDKAESENGVAQKVITMDLAVCGDASDNAMLYGLPAGATTIESIDGGATMTWTDADGITQTFDLSDPDAQDQIHALGGTAIFIGDSAACCPGGALQFGDSLTCKMVIVDTICAPEEAGKIFDAALPSEFGLSQNYPNPFNPSTEIDFSLPRAETVTLEIYNIKGQLVKTLVNDVLSAGTHTIQWNGETDGGEAVASGVYLYRLTAGDFTETKKMSLVK